MTDNTARDAAALAVLNRRALLTGTGVAVAAASTVAMVQPAAAFHATPAENAPRYRDSEHVKTFYRIVSR